MPLDYKQSADLMNDSELRGRIKVAGLKYSGAIFNEDPNEQPGHSARYRWAQRMVQIPDQVALDLQPQVVMDGQVQLDGSQISDTALQTVVETVVNKIL